METTNQNTQTFKLKAEALIIVPGTSKSYSNANLTDEAALDYLAKNPNRKQIFAKMPDDIDEQIANYKAGTPAPKVVKLNADELVTIGETNVTVEVAVSLLEKVNVKTKATTVTGVEKVIKGLPNDTETALIELAKGTVTASVPSEDTQRAELQLAYDNAQEAFDNLPSDASEEDKAAATKLIENTETALIEFDEKANQ